jgi:hypothetical protein
MLISKLMGWIRRKRKGSQLARVRVATIMPTNPGLNLEPLQLMLQ